MEQRPTKYYSAIQERKVADYLGWKVVSGSGSRPLYPGDIEGSQWLGECKTHTSNGHKIIFSFDVWDKISKEALSRFKSPVLICDDGSQDLNRTWCMVDVSKYVDNTTCRVTILPKDRRTISYKHDDLYRQTYIHKLQVLIQHNSSTFLITPLSIFKTAFLR